MATPSQVASKYKHLVFTVAKKLLAERGYSQRHIAGESLGDVREIVQHLLVMRPAPDDDALEGEEQLYAQMDEVLEIEKSRLTPVDALHLPSVVAPSASELSTLEPQWKQISLWKGDITTLNATAIVNAANSALLGCFQPTHKCIDNVIHCKAGPRLRTACHGIMSQQIKDEPVGDAKITPGFALPSTYVIHTVGPQLRRGQTPTTVQRYQLQSCYTSSLDLLLKTTGPNTPASIAFPCISTGLFAFPSDIAVPLVVDSVVEWLKGNPEASSWRVIFNTFLQTDHDLYKKYIESKHEDLKVPAPASDPTLETASKLIDEADYLLITAGAGLSAAAGLDYTSEEVMQKFHAPMYRQGLKTMYHLVGRTDFPMTFFWGYYFKQINVARLNWTKHRTAPTYAMLKSIRDHFESKAEGSTFVATTNADGMFGQEGFPLESVHTMQGDYGYVQCKTPCTKTSVFDIAPFVKTGLEYINEETYYIEDPRGIPKCPNCGGEMSLFLRLGHWFLESYFDDKKKAYRKWLSDVMDKVQREGKKLVILEIGVGFNTPGILRLPDERLAAQEGVSLVRVNQMHPEIPFDSNGVGANINANDALAFITETLALKYSNAALIKYDVFATLPSLQPPNKPEIMEPCSLIAAFLVPRLRGSIPQALQEIKELCVPMRENRMVCLRVHARLHQIWQQELQFVPTARMLRQRMAPVLGRYAELLVRFADLLKRFATDDCVFRLILNRQLFVKLDQLHRDIDAVVLVLAQGQGGGHEREAIQKSTAERAPRDGSQESLDLGRVQWEADRKVQQQLDRHRSGYTVVVQSELRAIDNGGAMLSEIREALAEVVKGSSTTKTKTSGDNTILLLSVVNTHDATGKELIKISGWRFVRRDFFVDKMISSGSEASSQSTIPATHSGAVQPRGDSELQKTLASCKFVRSHSACHLCTLVVFAFDRMATTSDFGDLVNALREQLVSLFYSVELSLHYLHEKELFSGSNGSNDDQSVGVCEFGFANLSLGQNKRGNEDIIITNHTLLRPSTPAAGVHMISTID